MMLFLDTIFSIVCAPRGSSVGVSWGMGKVWGAGGKHGESKGEVRGERDGQMPRGQIFLKRCYPNRKNFFRHHHRNQIENERINKINKIKSNQVESNK